MLVDQFDFRDLIEDLIMITIPWEIVIWLRSWLCRCMIWWIKIWGFDLGFFRTLVPTPSPALPCFFDPGRASQSRRSTLDRRRCGGTCPIRTNLTSALDSTPLEADFRNKSGWSQILWCHGCRGWVLSASLDIRRRKAFGFEYTLIAWRKKEPLAPRTTHSGNLKCPLSFSAA